MRFAMLVAAAPLLAAPAFGATLTIDPAHSSAGFTVKHMMVSTVHGQLGKVTGTVQYDPAHVAKTVVEANIDATGIDTRDENRDKHLKSPDFFDTDKCPKVEFKSNKVTKGAAGHLKVAGDLTMHCVTKPVVLDVQGLGTSVKDPKGNKHYGATATTKLNRKEYGINWSKSLDNGGAMVSDDVEVRIDLELVESPAAAKDAAKVDTDAKATDKDAKADPKMDKPAEK